MTGLLAWGGQSGCASGVGDGLTVVAEPLRRRAHLCRACQSMLRLSYAAAPRAADTRLRSAISRQRPRPCLTAARAVAIARRRLTSVVPNVSALEASAARQRRHAAGSSAYIYVGCEYIVYSRWLCVSSRGDKRRRGGLEGCVCSTSGCFGRSNEGSVVGAQSPSAFTSSSPSPARSLATYLELLRGTACREACAELRWAPGRRRGGSNVRSIFQSFPQLLPSSENVVRRE